MVRSPTRSAACNSTSTAGAKWLPKTSAVVVPGLDETVDEVGGDPGGVRRVGEPGLLGQGAVGQPVEQRQPEPADDPHLRQVHVGVDEAGERRGLRAGRARRRAGVGGAAADLGDRAAVGDAAVDDEQPAVVLGRAAGPGREGVLRGVDEGATEEERAVRPLTG